MVHSFCSVINYLLFIYSFVKSIIIICVGAVKSPPPLPILVALRIGEGGGIRLLPDAILLVKPGSSCSLSVSTVQGSSFSNAEAIRFFITWSSSTVSVESLLNSLPTLTGVLYNSWILVLTARIWPILGLSMIGLLYI